MSNADDDISGKLLFGVRCKGSKDYFEACIQHDFIGVGYADILHKSGITEADTDEEFQLRWHPDPKAKSQSLKDRATEATKQQDRLQRYLKHETTNWTKPTLQKPTLQEAKEFIKERIPSKGYQRKIKLNKLLADGDAEAIKKQAIAMRKDSDESAWKQAALFDMMRDGDAVLLYGRGYDASQEPKKRPLFAGLGIVCSEGANNPKAIRDALISAGAENHGLKGVRWLATEHAEIVDLLNKNGRIAAFKTQNTTVMVLCPGFQKKKQSPHTLLEDLAQKNTSPAGQSKSNPKNREPTPMPSDLRQVLRRAKNLVLEGVPGTGKTFAIKQEICRDWHRELMGKGTGNYAITLHPATTYEDFVEGLRPTSSATSGDGRPGPAAAEDAKPVANGLGQDGEPEGKVEGANLKEHRYFHVRLDDVHGPDETGDTDAANAENPTRFRMQDGFFLRVCAQAVNDPNRDYVVLLDEINRCNIPKVMGDLLTTLERSKRARWLEDKGCWDLSKCQEVTLPGSQRLFFVPDNLYVVATMNTTDRSVAPMDAALRRRFAFTRLWPKGFKPGQQDSEEPWNQKFLGPNATETKSDPHTLSQRDKDGASRFKDSLGAWIALNDKLREYGPDAMLGHSYLFDLAEDLNAAEESSKGSDKAELAELVEHHWNVHLLPQLADIAASNHLEDKVRGGGSDDILSGIQIGEFEIHNATPNDAKGLLNVPTLRLQRK